MRQRRAKNLDTRYAALSDFVIDNPIEHKGRWHELRDRAGVTGKIYLEIGCGKGKFISETAEANPDDYFIAIEGHRTVLLKALEKVRDKGLNNVVFIPKFVEDLTEWFADGEVGGIYLNFSDPHPKTHTAKRRLTHRTKLKQYFRVLDDDGIVIFKTDNTQLFEFTIGEITASDLKILELTRDLHRCEYGDDNVMTEYEHKFSSLGENIKRVKIGRKADTMEIIEYNGFAAMNGRVIPKEDKIFGISNRAKDRIAEKGADAVINATIGTFLDDDGNIIVLSSVDEAVKQLEPRDYADYAPIAGIPGYREAIKKAALGNYQAKGYVGVVASPGGTGSIRNAIANYTCPGDKILTHDWHWTPYNSLAAEQQRGVETFEMFDAEGKFNLFEFEYKVKKLLRIQDRVLVILNTPANNPTGYALSEEDWDGVIDILNQTPEHKKVALLVDVAYIDFAGDTDETRIFLPKLEELNANILPMMAYSASKTFTFYGFRTAALICIAKTPELAEEFERCVSYSSRASWSNSPRGPQTVIATIYQDPELLARVDEERAVFRDMLLARGRAFEEEAREVGLEIVPFRAGFFVSVPCEDPDALSAKLEERDVFCIPMSKGIRVSVASISEEKARKLPKIIKDTLDEM